MSRVYTRELIRTLDELDKICSRPLDVTVQWLGVGIKQWKMIIEETLLFRRIATAYCGKDAFFFDWEAELRKAAALDPELPVADPSPELCGKDRYADALLKLRDAIRKCNSAQVDAIKQEHLPEGSLS